jgi:serine/threonine protein kinase
MAAIISDIVLAIRSIRSRDVIHRNLRPNPIPLDCNWNVPNHKFWALPFPRIFCQGCSILPTPISPFELYSDMIGTQNDVFSFGLILYELIVGESAFPNDIGLHAIASKLMLGD